MDFKRIGWISLGVAAISWLLSWLYGMFFKNGIANISFSVAPVDVNVANQIKAGIDTSLAGKLIGSLQGVVPANLQSFLLLFVASALVVMAGRWLNNTLGNFGKGEVSRFAVDLTFGSIIVGLVVGAMSPSIGILGTVLAMLLYFVIVAFVYGWLRKSFLKDYLPAPL